MVDPAPGADAPREKRVVGGGMVRPVGDNELSMQVRFSDSDKAFTDTLIVTHLRDKLWRLEENPVWSEFAAWHDVVEADTVDGELIIRRVVESSGCRTIKLYVAPGFSTSEQGAELCERVLEAGGMWEIYAFGYLILNVPGESDVDWEEQLDEALQSFERDAD